jgi:hypothetical protein
MIKLILYIIIIGIILEHLLLLNNTSNKKKKKYKNISTPSDESYSESSKESYKKQPQIITFDNPEPWNKIIFDETNQYPYTFYISLDIPSFNIYHDWKQIIPTLNFIPQTKELTISIINEDIAIAIINLIILTFSNKVSLDDIIDKDLINISISKVSNNPNIKSNFKNQIIEYLYTPNVAIPQELTQEPIQEPTQEPNNFISAYDGSDYSYL